MNKKFHIFSFTQEKDGSIYANWPNFEQTKWIFLRNSPDGLIGIEADSPGAGKFTVHGSGMSGFREHNGRYDNVVLFHGNQLINPDKSSMGIRHLFTAQIPEPSFVPLKSPYLNRKSDYNIDASHIVPAVLVFFAFPKQNFQLQCDIAFHKDNIVWSENGQPTSYLGAHIIELDTHLIVWIAYRTTNMFWPTSTYILYDNGYKIPIVIGKGDKAYTLELRDPLYSRNQNTISIKF